MLELVGELIFHFAVPMLIIVGLMLVLGVLNHIGGRMFPKVHPYFIAVGAGVVIAAVIMTLALHAAMPHY